MCGCRAHRDGSRFEKLFAEEGGEGVEADVVLLTVGAEDCRNVRSRYTSLVVPVLISLLRLISEYSNLWKRI